MDLLLDWTSRCGGKKTGNEIQREASMKGVIICTVTHTDPKKAWRSLCVNVGSKKRRTLVSTN